MKLNIFRYLIFIMLATFQLTSCAQSRSGLSDSRKATKYFEDAREAFRNGNLENTILYLDKALVEDPEFKEALRMQAVIFFENFEDFGSAAAKFEKMIQLDENYDPAALLYTGEAYFYLSEYEKSKSYLKRFLEKESTDEMKKRARLLLKSADFAAEAKKNPVPFNINKLSSAVNTQNLEYFPALTADQQYLYFTRQSGNGKYAQEDIYFSGMTEEEEWFNSILVEEPVTTPHGNEGAHTISPDGKFLIFTSCDRRDSYGGCDLYITKKTGDEWGVPKNLGPAINSGAWETQPSISSDSRALYFVSNRKGGYGRSDIYVSHLGNEGFEEATNLGPVINTFGNESRPFIHPDNTSLYFASDGHPGMGRSDNFISRKNAEGWQKPENLGYPINTVAEEPGIFVTTDGKMAYFSSDIEEKGNLDIYSFELPAEVRPKNVTYFKAMVYDAASKKPLEALVQIVEAGSEDMVTETLSDPVNGSFIICLLEGRDYLCNVSKEGYLFYSENFLLDQHPATEPYIMEIPLKKIGVGKTIILKNIFFDSGEYRLKEASIYELEKLYKLLAQNPMMKIEISGHTDNVGSDVDNKELSGNRARSVYDFLIDKGIGEDRLSYKGYGEEKPVAENSTVEGRAKNRRTEFTILQM